MTYDSAEKYEELYFKHDNCCELGKLKVRCVFIGLIKKRLTMKRADCCALAPKMTFNTLNVDTEAFIISRKGTHQLKQWIRHIIETHFIQFLVESNTSIFQLWRSYK